MKKLIVIILLCHIVFFSLGEEFCLSPKSQCSPPALKKRSLGSTSVQLSEIGMGTAFSDGFYGSISPQKIEFLISYALKKGISWVDTADLYSPGEEIVGKLLKSHGPFFVATKIGRDIYNASPSSDRLFTREYLEYALEMSLSRLGVEVIDLLFLHGPFLSDINSSLFQTLEEFKRKGKVKLAGISVNSTDEGVHAIKAAKQCNARLDVIQVIFNILNQEAAVELFPLAQREGIGIVVREPLCRGYLRDTPRAIEYEQEIPALKPYLTRHGQLVSYVEELKNIFRNHGRTESISLLALKYCLSHPAVSTVIPGLNNMKYIDSVSALYDMPPLSPELMEEVRQFYFNKMKRDGMVIQPNSTPDSSA